MEENIEVEVVENKNEQPKPPEEDLKNINKKEKKDKKKNDKELEKLKEENNILNEKILRITAEMQNMRRRYDIDISNLHKYDGFLVIEKLLPVIDNFERAMKVKQEGAEKFLEGFKMIYDNLIAILNSKGVVEIDALGKDFDPTIMNAVMTEENSEVNDNIVLEVLQKGYMYNDKLVRPAMVKVSENESK